MLTTLQGRADSKGTPASFSWSAISNMMQNIGGQEVNYDSFKSEFDSNPALQNVIDNFNADGVTIKTKKKPEPQTSKNKGTSGVDSSAKRAAAKLISR